MTQKKLCSKSIFWLHSNSIARIEFPNSRILKLLQRQKMESLLGVRVVGSIRAVELPSDTVLWEKAIFIALIAVMVSGGLYVCYNIYNCTLLAFAVYSMSVIPQ